MSKRDKLKNSSTGQSVLFDDTSFYNRLDSPSLEEINKFVKEVKAKQSMSLGVKYDDEVLRRLETYTDNEIKKIKKELVIQKEENNKLITEFDNKIKSSEKSIIESLALFAAFFTFISVNVQIFTRVKDLKSAMWFTLLLFCCLGLFAWMVHVLINKEVKYFQFKSQKRSWSVSGVFFLPIIFILLIFAAIFFRDEQLNIQDKEENDINQTINIQDNVMNLPETKIDNSILPNEKGV